MAQRFYVLFAIAFCAILAGICVIRDKIDGKRIIAMVIWMVIGLANLAAIGFMVL
ncbi:MAG: hypothetical protein IJ106_10800 [Parasporobacterium sp.]|nr:hypothetical protein [Parasporobacterium sp.]